MKLTTTLIVVLSAASLAPAQTSTNTPVETAPVKPSVRHVIGLDPIKRDATGTLTVADGALDFKTATAENKVPISAIDDIIIGTETTQSGGKTGRVVKTAAIAAPYESGKVLTILMRTKVDVLTVAFHDPGGALHGAIFALPIGQAEEIRGQLIRAGAHASPLEEKVSAGGKP